MRLTRVTLLCLALIIALGFYRLIVYILDDIESQTFQATEEVMVDTAHVMAGMIEGRLDQGEAGVETLRAAFEHAKEHQLDAKIYQLNKTNIGLNAYLTDNRGIVLFDSDNDRLQGQDLSRYNDVILTLEGKYGARSSRRDEDDPQSSILYVAAPVCRNGKIIGVLTVYKPQADLFHFIHQRRSDILSATILIGSGVIFFTGAIFIWLFKPIGRLTAYARSISRGERPPAPNLGRGREVNTLGKALIDMRETLEGKRYVENYVATLTHELKSPLAAIKGAAELLGEDLPVEKKQRFLENILRETNRSERLVRDLLQLAELERKPQLENKRKLDLSELCREIAHEIQARLDEKHLVLESHIDPKIIITGDAMILKLAIINLLENAIGFAPQRSEITFELCIEHQQAIIRVVDQGPGMPDYAMERAFDHFYSLPRPDSDHKGTGLGLPLVQEAAKLHDGMASLENRDDKGCLAAIKLPLS